MVALFEAVIVTSIWASTRGFCYSQGTLRQHLIYSDVYSYVVEFNKDSRLHSNSYDTASRVIYLLANFGYSTALE